MKAKKREMYLDNKPKVEKDVDAIVARLRAGETTLAAEMRRYRCGHATIRSLVDLYIPPDEWQALRRAIIARINVKGRLKKGNIPWNKGVKDLRMSPATEFRPGQMRGNAARKYRPIGTISRHRDKCGKPYLWIKLTDAGPPAKRWAPLHRHVWEQAHGPIPRGKLIIHFDGDSLNNDLSNLRLVDRRGHIKRQRSRDPTMEAKRLAACRRPWTEERRRKCSESMRRSHLRRKEIPPITANWTCNACGADYDQEDRPEQCAKCQSLALEPARRKSG